MNSTPSLLDTASSAANAAVTPDWNALTLDATLAALDTTRLGLSSAEAARRLQTRLLIKKRSVLPEPAKRLASDFAAAMFRELADPVHLLLFLVALAGATLGAPAVAVAVVALTVARIALLAWAAWRCESITAQLRHARAPHVRVLRDGAVTRLDLAQLVAGDVIELAVGAGVPADLKLIEHDALTIDGAVLQGTANGVGDAVSPLLWSGGWITHGHATAVVVATGADAAAAMLSRLHAPTDEPPRAMATPAAPPSDTPVSDTPTSDAPVSDALTSDPPSPRPSLHIDRHNVIVLVAATAVLVVGVARNTDWLHCLMAAVALTAICWSASTRWFAPLQRVAVAVGARRLLASDVLVRDVDVFTRLAALPMSERESTGIAAPTITIAGKADNERARASADVVFDKESEKLAEAMALAATTARGALGAAARATTVAQAVWAALIGTAVVLATLLAPSWPASVLLALHVLALGLGLSQAYVQHPTTVSTQPPRWLYGAIAAAIGVAAVVATRLGMRLAADTATLAFASFAFATMLFTLWAATERRNTWRTRLHALWQGPEAVTLAAAILVAVIGLVATLQLPLLRDAFETGALNGAGWGAVLGLAFGAVALQFGSVIAWRKWRQPRPPGSHVAASSPTTPPTTQPTPQRTAQPIAPAQSPQDTSPPLPPES